MQKYILLLNVPHWDVFILMDEANSYCFMVLKSWLMVMRHCPCFAVTELSPLRATIAKDQRPKDHYWVVYYFPSSYQFNAPELASEVRQRSEVNEVPFVVHRKKQFYLVLYLLVSVQESPEVLRASHQSGSQTPSGALMGKTNVNCLAATQNVNLKVKVSSSSFLHCT